MKGDQNEIHKSIKILSLLQPIMLSHVYTYTTINFANKLL